MLFTTFSNLFADRQLFLELTKALQGGGIVALPTDTLYGLAVDGASPAGVEAIYQLKGREETKPLILFLPDLDDLSRLSLSVDPRQLELLQTHWPGALTAVFPFPGHPLLSAFRFPSLGIRIPALPDLRRFLREYPGLLLTTSANRSQTPPLPSAPAIRAEFGCEVAGIIDGGQLSEWVPSTVADFSSSPPRILRQGKIAL